MGLSPLAVCEPLHTVVQLHAESEYELMALTTSESTTATSTSQTWFGCHAKGSDWADAVDREAGIIGGTSAAGVYYRYATGGSEYLVETQYLWDATSETAWESGSSSGASHMGFAEVGRGDRRYLSEESGVFDGPNAAGSYASWSRTNDTIDYVGTHWNYSHTETHLADGTSLVWTCENEFGYTGVGAFRAGDGDSGSFDADGQTGLWYSGFAATLTTSYGQATTFYTSTAVPTRTFAYPMGSGTCTYTMPGWSSWNEHRWTVESESRFDAGWITWVRYSPAESVEGYFGAEGEARTDRWTWLSTSSYTGPAGHLFEQRFGSTTTVTHTSTSVGTPPDDVAVIAAMNAIANQRIGESASGGHGTAYSTDGQGDGGIATDAVVAAKDLNLAEFFAQAAAQPSSQPAWQAAGQLAGDASEPGSEPAKAPPARHPDSAMPESWLDALDELEDHAKTAHDEPEQLPALTDAAILHLTAMEDPANPGRAIVQTCVTGEGDAGRVEAGGAPGQQPWVGPGGGFERLPGGLMDISLGADLAEARRIGQAIQNTWRKNWRLYPPITIRGVPQTVKGYWCYEWAYAFAEAAEHESSGKHFEIKIWSASADDERLHAWLEIKSRKTNRSIYVDDGFWETGTYVHSKAPYGGDYKHLRPGVDVPRDRCSPPRAYDSTGRRVRGP